MNQQINESINKLFQKHRIIFWYDEKKQFEEHFADLILDDAEAIKIENNEFAIKYKILREDKEKKFLVYKADKRPDNLQNWLLDVELYSGEFRTDKIALWLADLGLGLDFVNVVEKYQEFFSPSRLEKLKSKLSKNDTPSSLPFKMMDVVCSSGVRIDETMESLLSENSENRDRKYKELVKFGLSKLFWEQIKKNYGYESDEPSVKDFVVTLFKDVYERNFVDKSLLNSDALVFMNRWKDSRKHQSVFEHFSKECEDILKIEDDVINRDFRDLLELDYFDVIEVHIIRALINEVVSRSASHGDITLWIRNRRQSHWYEKYSDIYEAIDYASKFIAYIDKTELNIENLKHGIDIYSTVLFEIDKMYRKFTYHMYESKQVTLLEKLSSLIENIYTNNYLVKLGDNWQTHIDKMDRWQFNENIMQKDFYKKFVQPTLDKNGKIYVIISDALRYEIAHEFVGMMRQEDMFEAKISPIISMLPSYTQLGMASLLPNKNIQLSGDDSGTVIVDDINSRSGNREKVLKSYVPNSMTISAKEFLGMTKTAEYGTREVVRDNDVVYIYHNIIDHEGKQETEDTVFRAAEECLNELKQIVRKLTSANATNIIVTADHGFLYQFKSLQESDFAQNSASGEEVLYLDRRFVIGKNLEDHQSFKKFSEKGLGLDGGLEVLIPKSINRLRKKRSSSKFVHGGATLQEIVVPVVQINKKRKTDTLNVDVSVISGQSSIISSGQISVTFYQQESVTDKLLPRVLKVGIYSKDGILISDTHTLTFDLKSDNPREREMKVRFLLSTNSDDYNNQEVFLRLEKISPAPETSHDKFYGDGVKYTLRKSIKSDFDF